MKQETNRTVIKLYDVSPSVAEYRMLREASGLSPKSEEAAIAGLAGGLFAVTLRDSNKAIGMGRIIGDGGCHYQIVDIAVLPTYQGQGWGTAIMERLMEWVDINIPDTGYISLIADGDAKHLYAKYGFQNTAPASIGMAKKIGKEKA